MKLKLTEPGEDCCEMGRADYRAGLPREAASEFFGERSLAFKYWQEGWDQAARFPLFVLMEESHERTSDFIQW